MKFPPKVHLMKFEPKKNLETKWITNKYVNHFIAHEFDPWNNSFKRSTHTYTYSQTMQSIEKFTHPPLNMKCGLLRLKHEVSKSQIAYLHIALIHSLPLSLQDEASLKQPRPNVSKAIGVYLQP